MIAEIGPGIDHYSVLRYELCRQLQFFLLIVTVPQYLPLNGVMEAKVKSNASGYFFPESMVQQVKPFQKGNKVFQPSSGEGKQIQVNL
jgi:hypothetical protein